MADLPLLLAGPILRRVEPTLVTVWAALSEPRALLLTVFDDFVQAGTATTIFTGGQPRIRGATNTLRVGEKLHIGVVIAEAPATQPLTPEKNYSYNLGLGPFDAAAGNGARLDPANITPSADLRSLGLLDDQPVNGRRNEPLGYRIGELPSFALPPAELTDLRLLHASCRRPHVIYPDTPGKQTFDGLAWVDDLIKEWRDAGDLSPRLRPHQLFMTGDQIYADDVSPTFLPMLNRLGNQLLGKTELLPTRYPPKPDLKSRADFLQVDAPRGFGSLEEFITERQGQGKTPEEILEELKDDPRIRVLEDPCFERQFRALFVNPFSLDSGLVASPADPNLHLWPADLRHFPATFRRPLMECEARLTSVDLNSHLVSFGEYCAMYLAVWSNQAWDSDDGRTSLATIDQVYDDRLPDNPLPQLWDLYLCNTDSEEDPCLARTDKAGIKEFLAAKRDKTKNKESFREQLDTLEELFKSLPRVRRALANIPSYMVFDDHDITDDWNLSRAWRDRVFTAPLGRQILTSALAAYVLFQDWGNDPKRYLQDPFKKLLGHIAGLFPAADPEGPSLDATRELEELFGLNQSDPETPAPQIKWHFRVEGPRHRVLALDTRTRRVYRSRYLPPGLLSSKALDDQLPSVESEPIPAGIDVVFVISQTPVLLPSLVTAAIVPFYTRIKELSNHDRTANLTGVDPDNEIWPTDDRAYEDLLKRLAEYKQVVILSGEIHYGYSAQMSYWKKPEKRFTLAAGLQTDLDSGVVTAGLRNAFQTTGLTTLSTEAVLKIREGNDEWQILDPEEQKVFLVRKEETGLVVYLESGPARLAQFTSSGIKNVIGLIFELARGLGFLYPMVDLTPAERLGWQKNDPPPLSLPDGTRLAPPVRARLKEEPLFLPTRRWPVGTKRGALPDAAWRMDLVRDERPEAERAQEASFASLPAIPEFDASSTDAIRGSYRQIAARHAGLASKLRFTRGVIYQSNLGLVRFEKDGETLVAFHDLYSHQPGKHQAVRLNVYRVPLQVFDEERPMFRFEPDDED